MEWGNKMPEFIAVSPEDIAEMRRIFTAQLQVFVDADDSSEVRLLRDRLLAGFDATIVVQQWGESNTDECVAVASHPIIQYQHFLATMHAKDPKSATEKLYRVIQSVFLCGYYFGKETQGK